MAWGIGLHCTKAEDADWPNRSIFITETEDVLVAKHKVLVVFFFSFFFSGCSNFPLVCSKPGLLI